ncbi:MAG: ParB/RepB/Spo0J family partition protein [Clostridia bacterium]|nr:ParB/RepB/Spo0J family partition protein [Clostridia bacterium]
MSPKTRKGGLGRDFNSLFEDNMIETEKGAVELIRLSDIEPDRAQPRKKFDEAELASLAGSIATFGLLQPIVVSENADLPGTYRIIAGERRWRACRMAGLTEIPAVVFTGDELAAAQVSLVENIQRSDLSPVEEAMGYRALIEKFGMTQEQVADKVGKSRPAVANSLRLLDLPEEVLGLLADGKISTGHARALLGLKDTADIPVLAGRIIEKDFSVRETERAVKTMNQPPREVKKVEPVRDEQTAVYFAELERKSMELLGHRVRILDGGEGNRHLEIDYNGSEDLEELLLKLCGPEVFSL